MLEPLVFWLIVGVAALTAVAVWLFPASWLEENDG